MSTSYPTGLDGYTHVIDNTDNVQAFHVNDKGDAIEALQAKVGINSSALNTTIDYFLKHASGAYRNHVHDGTSDDGAKCSLSGSMADVTISSLQNLQFLRYNSSSAKWENVTQTYALDDLTDVLISGPAIRQSIYYNGASWENGYANAVYAA